VSLVLDTGALMAVEKADRDVVALIKHELIAGRTPLTHGGIIGQAWRGGGKRQTNLSRLLPALEVRPVDDALGRRAGVLLGRSRGKDVIDAAVVLLAADGDFILTSDAADLQPLAAAAGLHVEIVPV